MESPVMLPWQVYVTTRGASEGRRRRCTLNDLALTQEDWTACRKESHTLPNPCRSHQLGKLLQRQSSPAAQRGSVTVRRWHRHALRAKAGTLKVQRGILKVYKAMSDEKVENRKKVFTFSSDTGGFKCPVCSKFVSSDEMDLHLVMCLTKPRITYNEDVLSKDAGECAICLEELQQGDTIARLPCLCIYHKGCIDEWFEVNRSCPEHPSD
nr:PREDICTED: E3 ubiquitin-protein ligase ZNRF2 [Opisthocomus hoazin]